MSATSTSKRAVVFDFGGVMTTCATPMRVRAIVEANGLPWSAVTDAFAKHRRAYDLGDISVSRFYELAWREADITVDPALQAEIEEADTSSFLYRNERTRDWMRALRAQGHRIGILTNMPHELAPRFRTVFADFIALSDALVISSEEHLVKPMPEIYALMESRLGVAGREIVFVDDAEINCAGARACGWQTVRFTDNASAERALAALLRMKNY